jgi:hypothetical protein
MKIAHTEMGGFQVILERRAAELARVTASQSSADQMVDSVCVGAGSGDNTGLQVSFVSLRHSSFPQPSLLSSVD